jgi:RNA processing factor Prp31
VQTELTDFVEESNERLGRQNTSAIVGTSIAAKLIGMAGGLTELSRIPALQSSGLLRAK